MSKIIQAILAGILFTFILDFFFFLGIKLYYIDTHNIEVYYNILFADHQNIFLYAGLSAIFGYLIIYLNNKVSLIICIIAAVFTLMALIPPLGNMMGEYVLMSKDVELNDDKHRYLGDIYYDGRTSITFYDREIDKVILLEKNRLKERN